jgi:hypothetical protein
VRYKRCICICGTSPKLITFTLNIMSDDNSSVFFDGALVGSVPALSSTPTTITFVRSLAPGTHCIEIEVHNPIPYHSGLNVSGTATGSGLVRPVCCGRSKTPTPDSDCDVSSLTLASDHTWSIIFDASGGLVPRCASVITPAQPYPNWGLQPPAKWIGVNPDKGKTSVNGLYTFQKCFCVSEQTTLQLDISAFADDTLEIQFNGTTIFSSDDWAGNIVKKVSLPISVSRGCHCIQFKVHNVAGEATGLNAIIKLTGPNLLKESCCYCASCPCPPQPIILPPAYHQEGEVDHSDHSHISGVEPATATSSFSPMLLSVPNPTNGETVFKYQIPRESDVTLELYNTAGERIETLDTGWKLAGSHSLSYDVTRLPAGTYHLRLMFGSQSYSVPVSVR